MITYTSGGIWYILKLFQMRGSVFPSSLMVAVPCAAISSVLKAIIQLGYLDALQAEDSITRQTQVWAGFSFLVGFLIVFRTSQAYQRFWNGSAATHKMRAEWFDACSSLISFCRFNLVDQAKSVQEASSTFQNTLVRLFSMLHACALAELEEINIDINSYEEVNAFHFDLIDPSGFDEDALAAIKHSTSKVELVFSWIQFFVVDNILTGVLSIPPPILSRAFNEIANGMVAFHDAIQISYIPFPFPYAQTCDCLLVLHWVVMPFVASQWVSHPAWAFVFVFIQVFILWALNFIAVEIENPFGSDANDLDGLYMQTELNRHLMLLLQPETQRTPKMSSEAVRIEDTLPEYVTVASFVEVWAKVSDGEEAVLTARKENRFALCAPKPELDHHINHLEKRNEMRLSGGAKKHGRETELANAHGKSSVVSRSEQSCYASFIYNAGDRGSVRSMDSMASADLARRPPRVAVESERSDLDGAASEQSNTFWC
eukprot:TRINITY_DN31779_c0_g1_i1.p1 TRINITY_DN31779_c0_g1~~TRINITY_DN31779_c0_g1_i1.p1  ORF type:complete len:486 (-),score=90.23 TRINITY_DN31779_c0_g1_i1:224-1681(-)